MENKEIKLNNKKEHLVVRNFCTSPLAANYTNSKVKNKIQGATYTHTIRTNIFFKKIKNKAQKKLLQKQKK